MFRLTSVSRLLLLLALLSVLTHAQEEIFVDGFENHPPIIISTPLTEGQVAVAYNYKVDVDEIDGDLVFFRLTSAPDGMQIGELTGACHSDAMQYRFLCGALP